MLDESALAIGKTPMSDQTLQKAIEKFEATLKERTEHHLGYPYNLKFDSTPLIPLLKYSINNLGDPFKTSNYGVHSRPFEVAVLNFFADLWKIKREAFWGYTTSCGTEGNLLGVLYGREHFGDRECVVFCSNDTHYSVPKAAKMYRIQCELVKSQKSGEICYLDLGSKLRLHPGKAAILICNMGTTVRGAYDSVDQILDTARDAGLTRKDWYVHVDGALNGLMFPFQEGTPSHKSVTFTKEIDTISVSGHKMLGCPMPCGVVITRKEHMENFANNIEYLNSPDTTIMGSRNGQASIAMWTALQRKGIEGLVADVQHCLENARFLLELFEEAGVEASLNEFSTTVVFQRPTCTDLVRKWQLACSGKVAHVVVMPSSSKEKLGKFFEEYMAAKL